MRRLRAGCWVVVLLASPLAGCVVVPYKPKAVVEESAQVALDPAATWVTAGPRRLIEGVSEALRDEDDALTIVAPQAFADAAFPDAEPILARLLQPAIGARVSDELGARYLVLLGELQQETSKSGGMLFYLAFLGAQKSKEHETVAATLIDLRKAQPLGDVRASAKGTSFGVGAFYALFVVARTSTSTREGLARGIVAALREDAGAGPLTIAVMAAEPVWRPEADEEPPPDRAPEQPADDGGRP